MGHQQVLSDPEHSVQPNIQYLGVMERAGILPGLQIFRYRRGLSDTDTRQFTGPERYATGVQIAVDWADT